MSASRWIASRGSVPSRVHPAPHARPAVGPADRPRWSRWRRSRASCAGPHGPAELVLSGRRRRCSPTRWRWPAGDRGSRSAREAPPRERPPDRLRDGRLVFLEPEGGATHASPLEPQLVQHRQPHSGRRARARLPRRGLSRAWPRSAPIVDPYDCPPTWPVPRGGGQDRRSDVLPPVVLEAFEGQGLEHARRPRLPSVPNRALSWPARCRLGVAVRSKPLPQVDDGRIIVQESKSFEHPGPPETPVAVRHPFAIEQARRTKVAPTLPDSVSRRSRRIRGVRQHQRVPTRAHPSRSAGEGRFAVEGIADGIESGEGRRLTAPRSASA